MPETDAPVSQSAIRGCWFPRSRRSPVLARRMLRELLATVPDGDRYAEVGELLTSELVGNAVLHSGMPGRLLWVSFDVNATRLRIEVHDASDRPPVPQQPGPTAGCGRGLLIVEALAAGWGHFPRPGGAGKVVWCECAPAPLVVEV
ncbi:ATP-binding protein [Kitasatospora cathayae]|uniref:ATP-binding protein n=1 Tax=Kitasatospora cathayae TaxID=3004092 RepID=A0ABY7QE92_9ACTN|nr:ATP-binding protein [Kitasatospora sp. HUAS 3-15]WBP91048.1 ATP-binding protein [Kitasatospora sp. HUAS 3-15]